MALCKYRDFEPQYKAMIVFFFGKEHQVTKLEPNDNAYEILENMIHANDWAQKALALLPSVPGTQPGKVGLGLEVATLGLWMLDQSARINVRKCSKWKVFDARWCYEYNNISEFKSYMGRARLVVSRNFRSELQAALVTEQGNVCEEEPQ
jgi:hypothetical protein